MDLKNIKKITIPEGEVKKIEVNGVILWELVQGKVVESITLAGYTTTFNYGATWVYGGTVTANYSDGTTEDVTSSTSFSGYNTSSAGTQTVTASYTENGVTVTATYQITVNPQQFTITYSTCVYQNLCPASKTVNAGYKLTSADLPTLTGSTTWKTDHWTLSNNSSDSGTAVAVGTAVNSNITLYAVWKGTQSITLSNIYKRATRSGAASSVSNNVVRTSDGGQVSVTLTSSAASGSWYSVAMIFAGVLGNIYCDKPFKLSWTPKYTSVTFKTGSSTSSKNTDPKLVAQRNTAQTLVPTTETVSNNQRSIVVTNTSYFSGQTVRVRIGYGYNSTSNMANYSYSTISSSNIGNYVLQTPSANWTETYILRTLA